MSSNPTEKPNPSQRSATPPSSASVHPLIQQVQQIEVEDKHESEGESEGTPQAQEKPESNETKGKELVSSTSGKPKNSAEKPKSEMYELIRNKAKLLPEGYTDIKSLKKHYETQKEARKNRELLSWEWRKHSSNS